MLSANPAEKTRRNRAMTDRVYTSFMTDPVHGWLVPSEIAGTADAAQLMWLHSQFPNISTIHTSGGNLVIFAEPTASTSAFHEFMRTRTRYMEQVFDLHRI